jgi:hypothetical protein
VLFNRATEGARRLRPEYRTMSQWLGVKPDSYTVYGCILSLAPVEHVATERREGAQLYEVQQGRQASSLRKEIWEYLTYYITRSMSISTVAFAGAVQPGVSNSERIHGQRRNSNVVLFL